jgi:uncharacterized protein (TIGR01777 family)
LQHLDRLRKENPMRVLITGGTGLVGSRLVDRLLARGDQPVVLTRRPNAAHERWSAGCTIVAGDPTQAGNWMSALNDCDAVVNLAGENLFGRRWSTAFKERLRSSRLEATANIARALAAQPHRADGSAKVLISGSAIGFYGPHGDEELDETAPGGDDFLAQLCTDWEQTAKPATEVGARVVLLRTGIVLDGAGGALKAMLLPFRLFAGGPVASGRQVMSWIHNEDMSGLIQHLVDHPQANGPINATAPHPVTNREFARTLGRVLHRPSFMPTPGFALRVTVGQAAQVICTGQRVLPRRALQLGYVFRFPDLEQALRDVLQRPGELNTPAHPDRR